MKKLNFIFLISGFLFFSCTNFLNENSDSSESSNNLSSSTVAFNGTVYYSGAFPYELLEINDSESAYRSASYKIDSSWTYFATATYGSDTVSGTFGSGTEARTFEISLATGKTWTITCGIKKGETVLLSDTFSVTTSVDEPAISHTFFVKPGTSGTGVIGLTMTVDSLMITHVTAECSDSVWNNSVTSNPCTTTSGTTSILVASIPSGTYEVTFNFYDSSNILQYTTTQSINVFDNLTTNRWYSTSSENSPISDGTFEVTTALINAQKRTVFYVGNTTVTGNDTTGTGSPYAPLATITKACSFMTDSSADYKIFISGTVTGTQSVPSSLTGKAKSVIIQGFNGLENGVPKDSLDGNNGGTTLTISTSVPVTIKNLKITGGYAAENGGGISIASGSSVTILDNTQITSNTTAKSGGGIFNDGTLYLGGGVISKNTASEWGGGIFSNGTIFMYGSAVIGDMSKNVAATSSSCSNKADIKAGGIYSSGNLYMGYSDESTERALTGGVCYNFSKDCGGIYQLNGSTSKVFKLNSGSVSYNAERGIYVAKCSFTMTGGSVSGNKATNNGQTNGAGVYAGYESDVVISGGTISSNTAGGNGGGIYLAQTDSSVTIEGGTISGNLASGNGKGIAVANGSLKMKGGAKLDSGNDVYLASGKYITITGSLTGTVPVATITPASYSVGTTVLAAGTGVTLADEVGKFALTSDGYFIGEDGKLIDGYTAAEAISLISSMTETGVVKVIGEISSEDITNLTTALKTLNANNPDVRITLDLSRTTGLTELPSYAFADRDSNTGCFALEGIVLPSGLTKIGEYNFRKCTNLTTITIPAGVTEICDTAFGNSGLSGTLLIPASVCKFGYGVFSGTTVTLEYEDTTSIWKKYKYTGTIVTENDPDFSSTPFTGTCPTRETISAFSQGLTYLQKN